ncbi:MAG: hypothetical protein ABW321_08535 [Polyangiales bacterium]
MDRSRATQWSAAREAYLRSLELEPRVSTYFNLAAVSLQLRLGRATLEAIDDFVRLADPREHAEFLADAARIRAQALGLVGTVILHVDPVHATVVIDQESRAWPVGPARPVHLDEGRHTLVLQAPQHISSTHEVSVMSGSTTTMSVQLEHEPAPAPLPTPPPLQQVTAPRRERNDSWRSVVLWGGATVLGVGALTTLLVLVLQPSSPPPAYGGSLGMVFN